MRNANQTVTTNANGTITLYGDNLGATQAVWFGNDYAAPPSSQSASSVTVVPPAATFSGGTNVYVSTPAGDSQQALACRYSPYATSPCGSHYFFMQQDSGWNDNSSFGPYDATIGMPGVSVKASVCQASVTSSYSGQVSGSWTGDSQIWEADNSTVPSALLGFGTVNVKNLSAEISMTQTLNGSCDIPLRFAVSKDGFKAGLFLHVQGKISATLGIKVVLSGLSIDMGGMGWVNGQAVGGMDSSLSCKGTRITTSNLSSLLPCLSITFPASLEGELQIGPELEIGYSNDTAGVDISAEVGTLIGAKGMISTSTKPAADVCWAPIHASASFKLPVIGDHEVSTVIPGPVQLAGDPSDCIYGKPTVSMGQITAAAVGGNGTLSIGQYLTDPVGPVTFDSTGPLIDLTAISDPYTSVTLTDCDLNGGQALYWWNGTAWQYLPDAVYTAGPPGCINLTVTAATTPSLAQITNAIFGIGLAPPVSITTGSLPGGTTGTAYPASTLSATGGKAPYKWSVTQGSLPAGLSLDPATGTISGTPESTGSYTFTVEATDSEPTALTATKAFTVQISPAGSGSPASTSTAVRASSISVDPGVNVTYTATVSAPVKPGGTVDFLDGGADIANCTGIALSATAPYVATCTTSYPAPGTHLITASYGGDRATSGSVSNPVTVTVTPAPSSVSVTTSLLPEGTVGSAYPAATLAATGGTEPYSWSVPTGSLPPGLHLDAATGQLTGVPTRAGTFDFTVSVTDSAAHPVTATKALSVTVVSVSPSNPGPVVSVTNPLVVTTAGLPHAEAGSAYRAATVTPAGGTGPYRWSIWSGALPAGITLDPSTGVLSGVATVAGVYTFTVSVADSETPPATAGTDMSLTVKGLAPAPPQSPTGYDAVTAGGAVLSFGGAPFEGSAQEIDLAAPMVGGVFTPGGGGYWLVSSDGEVFAYGDAPFLGAAPPGVFHHPVVGMASTPDGKGYWLAYSNGRVLNFGDAPFEGSLTDIRLAAPVVGITATPDGKGYWLVSSDGGVFAYGDAGFFGSAGGVRLASPVVGIAATPDGKGYWLVAADGGVFAYGDAGFSGSLGGVPLSQPVVGMSAMADGRGYWLIAADGGVFAFGDAPFDGSAVGSRPGNQVVALMAVAGP